MDTIRRHFPRAIAPALFSMLFLLVLTGCSDRDLTALEKATADADPVVFADAFSATLDYSAFENSYYEALSIDETEAYAGNVSLKVSVPSGNWAGGAFWTHSPRDLSEFNALVFYARASRAITLGECGFGIDIVGPARYQTTITGVELSESWTRVVVPVPNPARLTNERGMFWYSVAAGSEAVDIWFDEVMYTVATTIASPRPTMTTATVESFVGEAVQIAGTETVFAVDGEDVTVLHSPYFFTYYSSDPAVARVDEGEVRVVGIGSATITAKLGSVDVSGVVTVTQIDVPEESADAPTLPASDVISIFSDAYADIPVDSWLAEWSTDGVTVFDYRLGDDRVKVYSGLDSPYKFAGIDFQSHQIDATAAEMTHFHLDIWAATGEILYLELVDFGSDGVSGGGDDTNKKLILHAFSNPSFVPGAWSSLDIPLASFTGMNFGNVSQLNIQTGDGNTVFVDNIYFHK